MQGDDTYVIGVDGGGTGCRAALADSTGQILATAKAGPANATTDFSRAVENVRSAVVEACGARVAPEAVVAHIGLAGIMSEADSVRFRDALGLSLAVVTDDRPTMLAGALGGGDGAVAAIGTGSFLAASKDSDIRCIGGWGLQIGDQSSGAWLGRALLEQVLLAQDGLVATSPLTSGVLDEFGGANEIVIFAASAGPQDYAKLAPRVVDASKADDAVGVELMTRGGVYLTKALTLLDPGPETPICLSGGLGPHYAGWIDPALAARVVPAKGSALDGALLLAQRMTCPD